VLVALVPTVAAVNGHAFGAGSMLGVAHDFRIMRADSGYYCFPEVGIHIPFTPGMAALIQAKLTPAAALEAMTTGRRYGGPDAEAVGLVTANRPRGQSGGHGDGSGRRAEGQGPRHPESDQVDHVQQRDRGAAREVVGNRDFADRYRALATGAWLRRTHRDRRGDDMTAVSCGRPVEALESLTGVGRSSRRQVDGITRLNQASIAVQIVSAADGGSSVW
jgi:enoyl-CoA hydratase/carnithine racemase